MVVGWRAVGSLWPRNERPLPLIFLITSHKCSVASAVAPLSDCYSLDKENYLFDFTSSIGREFRYEDQDHSMYVLRFCKDVFVEKGVTRVNNGRFSPIYFSSTTSHIDFVQEYRNGDLSGCEHQGYDYGGRTTVVSIICGSCPGVASCKDPDGCICSVTPNSDKCLENVVLAVNFCQRGPHVFSGFTVGFSPRGKEVVENGMAHWGYDSGHVDYRQVFGTQQSRVYLYLTARSSEANNIGKPSFKVYPEEGLSVQLDETASNGLPPTTESPTILQIDWRCEKKANLPYLVNVTIPVEGYDPVVFTLGKLCDYKQEKEKSGSNAWATFGVLSSILMVGFLIFCCAGFQYKTRVENRHGLDALPGFGVFTKCIEAVSGDSNGYAPADEAVNTTGPSRNVQRSSDGGYGAV
ncbi:unnamed protein product [Sphagnum compactum]